MDKGLCKWEVDYAKRLVKPGCTGVVIPMTDEMEYLELCPKCGNELANVGMHTDLELDPHVQTKERIKEANTEQDMNELTHEEIEDFVLKGKISPNTARAILGRARIKDAHTEQDMETVKNIADNIRAQVELLNAMARGSGNNRRTLMAMADSVGTDGMIKLPRKCGKHLFLQVHTAYVNGEITDEDLKNVLEKAKNKQG